MLDEIIKEVTKAEPQTAPISEPKVIIQPESEAVKPTETEPASIPQPVEVLRETSPEPKIAPKIETIEKVEPISVETPNEVKTEEIPVILPETPIAETKPMETTPEELPPSTPLPEEKPLASSESVSEPIKTEIESEKEIPETKIKIKSDPIPDQPNVIPIIIPKKNIARELLVKARSAIQTRKRKKLDCVLSLFAKQTKITNDEVEKLLHVSDATATRYLSQLEKEGKIRQNGKTGKSVFYSKI